MPHTSCQRQLPEHRHVRLLVVLPLVKCGHVASGSVKGDMALTRRAPLQPLLNRMPVFTASFRRVRPILNIDVCRIGCDGAQAGCSSQG